MSDRDDTTPARVDSVQEARARAERIRTMTATVLEWRQEIITAYTRRDWVALGYPDWDSYLAQEFGAMPGLGQKERTEVIREMRRAGMSTRAIASGVGVPQSSVARTVRILRSSESGDSVDGGPKTSRVISLDGRERPAVVARPRRRASDSVRDMETTLRHLLSQVVQLERRAKVARERGHSQIHGERWRREITGLVERLERLATGVDGEGGTE